MAELVLGLRDRELSRTPMTHTRMTVGRDAGCDVVIDNAGVSRTHAVIVFLDDEFRVRDMDSQNGITVNGKAVKEAVLNYGDVIGIGKFELRLLETSDQLEPPLETGSAPKAAAPRSVMGTMQLNVADVAGLRDQIAAKAAAKRGAQPGAAKPRAASGQPGDQKPRAGDRPADAKAGAPRATPAARPVPAASAVYPKPRGKGVAWKAAAIGLAVALVIAVVFALR